MTKSIVVCAGDLHTNSTVALCHPRFALDDGGTYSASKTQRWIWNNWLRLWDDVKEAKLEHNATLFVILNGEIADNLNHSSTQLVTRNTTDQMKHAIRVLTPALDVGDHFIVTRGTEAHSGPSAGMDEKIAEDIGAIPDPDTGTFSWWHFYGDIGGIIHDAAHHAGSSYSRPSTAGGASNRIAADLLSHYAKKRVPYSLWPKIAWRGHTHRKGDSFDNHPIRVIVNPSWQLTNAFGHKLAGGGAATLPIGASWAVCDGAGNYFVEKRTYEWPIRTKLWKSSSLQKTN